MPNKFIFFESWDRYLDTLEELSTIPVYECATGSVAYIIATQQVFILNSKKE